RLSPAFDINPNTDKDDHALAIDDADPSPITANLRATADFYRLKPSDADTIETQVRRAVAGWRARAEALKVSASDQAVLAAVIDPTR
ncbi:MAG: type II toxin-antitoxin system HipA family toxin, partial [Dokdonella sp.]